jgi:hypothetical protein
LKIKTIAKGRGMNTNKHITGLSHISNTSARKNENACAKYVGRSPVIKF